MSSTHTQVAIVGGGLAGLSMAILLAQKGVQTTLIERGQYPKHKVCGEYISKESFDFMQRLGLPMADLALPEINKFVLTSAYGKQAGCALSPGGIGISRYLLDDLLAQKAQQLGVNLITQTRIKQVTWDENEKLYVLETPGGSQTTAQLAVGAFGRISGLGEEKNTANKYIGVKYHVAEGPATDTIEIHNFSGGYCGISRIENNKYCMCYLARADKLTPYKSDFDAFENAVLGANPFLRERLKAARVMDGVRTANINFGVVDMHQLSYPVLGDAAGFIPPITGNGMSLAFRSANEMLPHVHNFINQKINRTALLDLNGAYINKYLRFRIGKGIFLQNLLFNANPMFNRALMGGLTGIPGLMPILTQQAVGKGF